MPMAYVVNIWYMKTEDVPLRQRGRPRSTVAEDVMVRDGLLSPGVNASETTVESPRGMLNTLLYSCLIVFNQFFYLLTISTDDTGRQTFDTRSNPIPPTVLMQGTLQNFAFAL